MFRPEARATLIGSLPLKDHREATEMIFSYMREIPLWAQLPCYEDERLLSQFAEGLPGIRKDGDRLYFDTASAEFEAELLAFFEDYLAVTEGAAPLEGSRFAFSERTSRGFSEFLRMAEERRGTYFALKGQVTGPFTMLTGLKDQEGKLAIFNPMLKDAVTKAMAMKGRYQVEQMRRYADIAIVFLDEPALAGFGSSAMVGITKEEATQILSEAVAGIKDAGGICGIHVCANTDWPVVLESGLDVLSFDAYGFFDKIILYREQLQDFLRSGGTIAWGLIPTLNQDDLEREDADSLLDRWQECTARLDLPLETIKAQAIITPSCGTGLLPRKLAEKALALTARLSESIRK